MRLLAALVRYLVRPWGRAVCFHSKDLIGLVYSEKGPRPRYRCRFCGQESTYRRLR